jgi:hypothetical protein
MALPNLKLIHLQGLIVVKLGYLVVFHRHNSSYNYAAQFVHLFKGALNICVCICMWVWFSSSLAKYIGGQLLDCMVRMVSFVRKCQTIFQSGYIIFHFHKP